MVITPNDLHNKDFEKKMFGYKTDDVDDYLDRVGLEFERLLRDKSDLERQIKTKNEQLAQFNELQASLSNAIIVAQDSADRLRHNARKEAELIIAEAEREAAKIIDSASERANRIIAEMDTVKKAGHVFRKKIQFLVEAQLDLIKSEQWDSVLSEESLPLATPELDKILEERNVRVQEAMASIEEESASAFEKLAENVIDNPSQLDTCPDAAAAEGKQHLADVEEEHVAAVTVADEPTYDSVLSQTPYISEEVAALADETVVEEEIVDPTPVAIETIDNYPVAEEPEVDTEPLAVAENTDVTPDWAALEAAVDDDDFLTQDVVAADEVVPSTLAEMDFSETLSELEAELAQTTTETTDSEQA